MNTRQIKRAFYNFTKHDHMSFEYWEKNCFPEYAREFLNEWLNTMSEDGISYEIARSCTKNGEPILYDLSVKEIRQCNGYTAEQWKEIIRKMVDDCKSSL